MRLVWQVVLCPAAASGSRTAASLDSLHLIRGNVRVTLGMGLRALRGHSSNSEFRIPNSALLRRHPGTTKTRPAPTMWLPHCGWSGGSCCIDTASTRSIVQTRAAHKRRGKCGTGTAGGLTRAERSGCRHSLPTQHYRRPARLRQCGCRTAAGRAGRVMLRGSKWKPHCGLGCASRLRAIRNRRAAIRASRARCASPCGRAPP